MSQFHGPQQVHQGAASFMGLDGKVHYRNKGVMRARRATKRAEAEARIPEPAISVDPEVAIHKGPKPGPPRSDKVRRSKRTA